MFRTLTIFLLLAAGAFAASFRLYLKDGSYQLAREYQVLGDRVRFYSIERSDWEEIPLTLIDLKRTEAEKRQREEAMQKEAAEVSDEEKFEQQQRDLVARIPVEAGVYYFEGKDLKALKLAEEKAVNSKGRSILKRLSPIPLVPGKMTVELEGEHSATVLGAARPEFYMRLDRDETFGIVRMSPKKGARVVQEWSIVQVSNEVIEKQQDIPVFRKQLDDKLYQIWPQQPLEPGEYAVIEYTPGEKNIETWDFACQPVK
jgi:hypothetical protein